MPKLIVLMFHGVVKDIPEYAVWRGGRTCLLRASDFERVVRWCDHRYRILRLSEVEEFLCSGSNETAILLTFDDALASVADWAVKTLATHGASAAVFVTTDWTRGGRTPTIFLLERDLWTRTPSTVRIESCEKEFTASITSRRDLQAVVGRIWSFLLSSETAPLALDSTQVTLDGAPWRLDGIPESREFWFPASVDELRRGVDEGIFEIGSHGVTHIPWTMLPQAELQEELLRSKEELEQTFQVPVESCSYPNGLVDPHVAKEVGEIYRLAFTSQPAMAVPTTEKTQLPRIHVPSGRPLWMGGLIRRQRTAAALRRAARLVGVQ